MLRLLLCGVARSQRLMLRPEEDDGVVSHRLLDAAGNNPAHVQLDSSTLGGDREPYAPSAAQLLRAKPYFSGYLYKKRECCCGLLRPRWKRRFFVISGRYLFRFASETALAPKGAPTPLECASFMAVDDEVLPHVLVISTLSKELVLASETGPGRAVWLEHLRSAKQRAIKENLGHATERAEHSVYNKMGLRLVNRKVRRERGDRLDPSAIEMRAFAGVSPASGMVDQPF